MTRRSKNLRILGVLLAFTALVFAWFFYQVGKPEREIARNPVLNSIVNQTDKWDLRVNLIPDPLAKGANQSEVILLMKNAGFEQKEIGVPVDAVGSRSDNERPNESFTRAGEVAYSRFHGNWVCDNEYMVFVTFDENEALLTAQGTFSQRGCL